MLYIKSTIITSQNKQRMTGSTGDINQIMTATIPIQLFKYYCIKTFVSGPSTFLCDPCAGSTKLHATCLEVQLYDSENTIPRARCAF